jgi:hypothetical protein
MKETTVAAAPRSAEAAQTLVTDDTLTPSAKIPARTRAQAASTVSLIRSGYRRAAAIELDTNLSQNGQRFFRF